jgi:hypothetical protein
VKGEGRTDAEALEIASAKAALIDTPLSTAPGQQEGHDAALTRHLETAKRFLAKAMEKRNPKPPSLMVLSQLWYALKVVERSGS